jgi:hypothetical protein
MKVVGGFGKMEGGKGNDGGEEGDRGRAWGGTRDKKRSVIRQSLSRIVLHRFRREKCRIFRNKKASLRADGRGTGPDETSRTEQEKRRVWNVVLPVDDVIDV